MAAAMRAAQLGASVTLIEDRHIGGLCVHWGCIPTKSMIHAAHLLEGVRGLGWEGDAADFPSRYAQLIEQKEQIVQRLAQGAEQALTKRGVRLVRGRGRFREVSTIEAGGDRVRANRVIVATGARPRVHDVLSTDADRIFSSDEVLLRRQLPTRLLIVGGGVSGCEFACLFHAMGVHVTLVEQLERILVGEDVEIAQRFTSSMQRRGIDVMTGATVVDVQHGTSLVVRCSGGRALEADAALVCIGRQANTSDMGLEGVGVSLDRGWITVNQMCQTSVPSIYAIGDVNGVCPLAHAATHQGIVAAEHALGRESSVSAPHLMPRCIFTQPEIASVGWTEAQAQAQGLQVAVARVPYRGIARSQTARVTEGLIKLVADAGSDRLVGAHVFGESATELISELTVVVQMGVPLSRLADVVHPHPTYGEGVWEAVRQLCGRSLYN